MSKTYGSLYNFSPETFILPRESNDLIHAIEMAATEAKNKGLPRIAWICKPSSSSQGKNIFLIHTPDELRYECSFVVQRYISQPMLIGGYKFDLRVYCLVTSFRPLTVFMYREGLVRFSSQKYDKHTTPSLQLVSHSSELLLFQIFFSFLLTDWCMVVFYVSCRYDPSDTSNLFSHLTNASINKDSPDLTTEKDVIGSGCKWTIATQFFDYLEKQCHVNPYYIWEQIKDIMLLTLLPIVPEVTQNSRSFELLGFG
jgi:tubulin polyglutamylase TTLL2